MPANWRPRCWRRSFATVTIAADTADSVVTRNGCSHGIELSCVLDLLVEGSRLRHHDERATEPGRSCNGVVPGAGDDDRAARQQVVDVFDPAERHDVAQIRRIGEPLPGQEHRRIRNCVGDTAHSFVVEVAAAGSPQHHHVVGTWGHVGCRWRKECRVAATDEADVNGFGDYPVRCGWMLQSLRPGCQQPGGLAVAGLVSGVGAVSVLAHHDHRHACQTARQRCLDRHVDDHPGGLHFVKPANKANKPSGTNRRSDRRPVQGATSGRVATATVGLVHLGYVGWQQTGRFVVDSVCQLRQRIDGK